MTQLLISVRNASEAILVQEFDIGILDVKEPFRGGLGASDPETLSSIVHAVSSDHSGLRKSFSAGELVDWTNVSTNAPSQSGNSIPPLKTALSKRYGNDLLAEFHFVKIGLAGVAKQAYPNHGQGNRLSSTWQTAWRDLFSSLPNGLRSVAVVYLDYKRCHAPRPQEIIDFAAEIDHCDAVLFDTCHKSGNLFSHVSISELSTLVGKSLTYGLQTVIAGSINHDCLKEVLSIKSDYIGVRGAVCRSTRNSEIDRRSLSDFIEATRSRC